MATLDYMAPDRIGSSVLGGRELIDQLEQLVLEGHHEADVEIIAIVGLIVHALILSTSFCSGNRSVIVLLS
jgi:hypothetical protein